MTAHAGIVRTNKGLDEALAAVKAMQNEYDDHPEAPFSTHPLETRNLLDTAEHVVRGAIARKANVGLHFNADLDSAPNP